MYTLSLTHTHTRAFRQDKHLHVERRNVKNLIYRSNCLTDMKMIPNISYHVNFHNPIPNLG